MLNTELRKSLMHEPYLAPTRRYRVHPTAPDRDMIQAAGEVIRRGGLVAFPTETVYGLGANAWDEAAVSKIFRAKRRPANDPLIVHIAQQSQLAEIALDIPDIASTLSQRFWPGALTVILKKQTRIPPNVTAGLDTIAVRMPDHPVALALLRAAAVPIAAPSANQFSRPSPTTAGHVMDDLKGHVDVLLDGGSASIGVESTILSLVEDVPRVLRPGGVSLEALRQMMPQVIYQASYLAEDVAAAPSPGTLLRHYSPRARVMLFRGEHDEAVFAAMRGVIANSDKVGVMALDGDAAQFAGLDVSIEALGATVDEAAKRLFSALRTLDQQGLDLILARAPQPRGLGLAVWDRLLRAAVGQVVEV